MSSGADLFVVCKQCGSEVSPYITECPYCGHRLRRRAPKLPRAGGHGGSGKSRRPGLGSLLGRSGSRPAPRARATALRERSDRWATERPYGTITLVLLGCAGWIAANAEPIWAAKLIGPAEGDWWRIFTTQFVYPGTGGGGAYAFVALLVTALFGWLLERRHGPVLVLCLFLAAGVAGVLAAEAVYTFPGVLGGNAGALALLACWAAPDLRALRTGRHYEGDLLGAGALAALLLALPFALPSASWLAGVVGGAIGLVVGLGLRADG